jgi:hypothetical protein
VLAHGHHEVPFRDGRAFLSSLTGLEMFPNREPTMNGWAIVEAKNFVRRRRRQFSAAGGLFPMATCDGRI